MQIWRFLPSIPKVTNINFLWTIHQYVIKRKKGYESKAKMNKWGKNALSDEFSKLIIFFLMICMYINLENYFGHWGLNIKLHKNYFEGNIIIIITTLFIFYMTVEGSCAYIVSYHCVSITPWWSFWAVNRSKYNLPTITWNVIPKGNMNKEMCLKHVSTHVMTM